MHAASTAEPDLTLTALLGAIRAGDNGALGRLYQSHGDAVYRTAFRLLGAVQDAEDVLQDVFVGLPRALRSYNEQGQFDAWLKRVTVRTALMKRRSESRRREEPLPEASDVREPSTLDAGDRVAIRQAIDGLPNDLRVVFMLKEVEGYSHSEIGQLLGITGGASAARLFRAWQALRKDRGT